MGGQRRIMEGHDSLCIRVFHTDNLIFTHNILIAWWLHLLNILWHYAILPEAVEQIMVRTKIIMTLGYTYSKRRLKNPPDIFCEIAHIGWLFVWIPSRLAWNPALWWRYQYLLCSSLPKAFTGNNNQEGQTNSDTYTRYTLLDSGCTHSINPYFETYTEYKLLLKGDYSQVNDIGGLIKFNEIGTVVLDLKEDTGKLHNLTFEKVY